ncbi:5'-deoxynucleotidase [Alicyclobacillus sp. SO9]|uniref:5'-deoxynucleotidase n=1 Tax=Alicyclobacillus sp. SO9 TaxID=2665646 RepID=UPI0018E7A228|nr:5'-deoxynucleotidase [Alicyclobacillus sp. SO9]QQE80279.1 5'-deoxynucleotidase [Alicyclobacillus sp. SO9]
MNSVFLALLHRLRSTNRWSGMVSVQSEDVAQHSFGVAVIAHMLCEIEKEVFGNRLKTEDVLAAALLHDATEAILTDVIAPVKKYSPEVEDAFHHLESVAQVQMIKSLPKELQSVYQQHMSRNDAEIDAYVHAADKLDALCKCKMELRRGNPDFRIAAEQIEQSLETYAERMPSVRYFMDIFLPAFDYSIDEYRYLQGRDGDASLSRGED